MKVAYLVSRYPAVSHTFIMREVEALRQSGIEVHTFSIRRSLADQLLTAKDREEDSRTSAILPAGLARLLWAHLTGVLNHPRGYFGALWTALRCRPPGLHAAIWYLFYFGEAGILAAKLRQRAIAHVHVHFANVAAVVAMLASQMSGITWSMTLHGLADFGNPNSVCLSDRIRRATFVICVSDFGRAQAMLHVPPEMWAKIHVVRCGLDTERFVPHSEPRQQAGREHFRLLSVGRLAPEKGHALLLEAVGQAVQQGIDLSCTIVGDGPERTPLERLAHRLDINDRVTFVGAVGLDNILRYYDAADAFVLASFAEGLPVVLMEALAKGLPVIATHIMGIPELIQDGVSGLLVVPGRATELAEAIARLATDPALRARIGASGRERVCREFDVRLTGKQLAQCFRTSLLPPVTDERGAPATATLRTINV